MMWMIGTLWVIVAGRMVLDDTIRLETSFGRRRRRLARRQHGHGEWLP